MSSATQSIPPSGSGGGIFFVRIRRCVDRWLPATDEKKRMCSFAHAFDRGLRRVLRMPVSA
ncbi:hypothetical protein F7R13_27055 [Burkholderia territorii]|uniref:Uncharacterized protein n=1 Tax=Burkholderia territorii TaxID=1503055 RepID=A0A6L3N928_9BURK|nr:hypothetical protein F7R13_27055 [Burkholderia territorii]